MPKKQVTMKTSELAALCSVDRSSISLWKKHGAAKYLISRDKWDVPAFLRWWARNIVQGGPVDDETERTAKERYWDSRATREGILVDQLEKRLVPVDEMERAFTDRARELARRLLLLSRRIAHQVSAESQRTHSEVVQVIDDEVYSMMKEYSRPITVEYEEITR